jgi:hypothetical protein
MIPCTHEGLIKFLSIHKLNPAQQKETDQVYVVFKIDGQDFPLFFRIYEGDELLQLLIFFPLQLRAERLNAMARMLHFLNKEIDVPGFGMDESVGLVFHRIMIPVFNKKIDTALMETYLQAVPKICKQFFPAIAGTALSDSSFDEILKKGQRK